MRGVARAAGVDPRLVHHYFDSKEDLLVVSLGFPARPAELLGAVLSGPVETIGERLVRAVLAIWDRPEGRERIVAILSGALTSDAAARMLREFLSREVLGRIAGAMDLPDSELRASLAASHLVGIAMARVVLRIEPLAATDIERLARIVGPVLQSYLTDPELPC